MTKRKSINNQFIFVGFLKIYSYLHNITILSCIFIHYYNNKISHSFSWFTKQINSFAVKRISNKFLLILLVLSIIFRFFYALFLILFCKQIKEYLPDRGCSCKNYLGFSWKKKWKIRKIAGLCLAATKSLKAENQEIKVVLLMMMMMMMMMTIILRAQIDDDEDDHIENTDSLDSFSHYPSLSVIALGKSSRWNLPVAHSW